MKKKSYKDNGMGYASEYSKKQKIFLELYQKKACNISSACSGTNITRQTYYNWRGKNEDFNKDCHNLEEALLDMAESKLYQAVLDGNTAELIFFLKTKGQSRGYIEKQWFDHTTKGDKIVSPIDLSKIDDKTLELLLKLADDQAV